MNQRELIHLKKDLMAWGFWVRSGMTWPNALGYPKGCGMDNIPCPRQAKSKVPTKFHWDDRLVIIHTQVQALPEGQQKPICGTYGYGMSERDLALKLSITRHKIRKLLYKSYQDIWEGLN